LVVDVIIRLYLLITDTRGGWTFTSYNSFNKLTALKTVVIMHKYN